MMIHLFKKPALTILVLANLLAMGCTKDKETASSTLKILYNMYKSGEIGECQYNGQIVYSAGLNAYDAGTVVYDINGNKIGECNYAWGHPDAICGQIKNCSTIYRCDNNIWGKPFVDKYGLSK
jgi:hypothetical protein